MITVRELFGICEDIELRNARIYADFMIRLGSDDDRVADFWQAMSAEEWEHYIILHFGHALCERAGMMNEPVKDIRRETIEEVAAIVAENEARIAEGDYTLREAFEMAIVFESSEGDALFLALVHQIGQAIERLGEYHLEKRIRNMTARVQDHHGRLVQAIQRLANDPELVRRARASLEES